MNPNTLTLTTLADGAYSFTVKDGPSTAALHMLSIEGGQVVRLNRDGIEQTGTCFPAAAHRAASIIERAQLTGQQLEDFGFCPAAQPIGNARACRLHRLMSRAGLAHAQHYTFAGAALTGQPVPSLAALYPLEARRVWAALCARFPAAASFAA